MARAGDTRLVVQVTQDDITNHENNNPYRTSLGIAILRQVEETTGIAAISLGNYNMAVGGFQYNLDPASIAFCNTEVAGISVTIPYTATLTIATII